MRDAMYPPRLITPPVDLIAVETLRAHCRAEPEDDAVLLAYAAAAVGRLDGYCGILGRCLVEQTWSQGFDRFETCMRIALPALSIVHIAWRDAQGEESVVPATAYRLSQDALGSFVRFRSSFSTPSRLDEDEAVVIEYQAGYGPPEAVPAALRSAVLLMVGALYRLGGDTAELRAFETNGAFREEYADPEKLDRATQTAVDRLIAPYRRTGL